MKATEKVTPGLVEGLKPGRNLESHLLRLLLRQPETLYNLDRLLQQSGLQRFSAQDFEDADHQLLARLVIQSLEQDQMDANHFLAENLPDPLQEIAHTYLEPFKGGEPNNQKVFADLTYTLLRLRESRVRENLEQLRFISQDLQGQADLRTNLDEMIIQFTLTLQRLQKTLKKNLSAM